MHKNHNHQTFVMDKIIRSNILGKGEKNIGYKIRFIDNEEMLIYIIKKLEEETRELLEAEETTHTIEEAGDVYDCIMTILTCFSINKREIIVQNLDIDFSNMDYINVIKETHKQIQSNINFRENFINALSYFWSIILEYLKNENISIESVKKSSKEKNARVGHLCNLLLEEMYVPMHSKLIEKLKKNYIMK
jgi:hypothetical protein